MFRHIGWHALKLNWYTAPCSPSLTIFGSRTRGLSTDADAERVDCVVIGAGVVGLACARALALAGREVIVLEQANTFGTETSSRHSEVIHAGLYYLPGSLKARLCVRGKELLYEYCAYRNVPHKRITKLVVATEPEQVQGLQVIRERAAACGVTDLVSLTGAEAQQLEPALRAQAALLSPSTGILDSHTYMSALLADIEANGGVMAVASRVVGGHVAGPSGQVAISGSSIGSSTSSSAGSSAGSSGGVLLEVEDLQAGGTSWLHARTVVNSAGLHAQRVSSSIKGIPPSSIPRQYLARGVYFTLGGSTSVCGTTSSSAAAGSRSSSARAPFSRLIYPLPPKSGGGLGEHLTLDMGGGARFGPDVEWVDRVEYTVDPQRAASFYPAIRAYWPGLPDGALIPGYAGVRPKLSGPGQPAADFMIQGAHGPGGHGVPGLICLYGIESPGLTSSLAIGEHVAQMVAGKQH